jgi:hypothetical protein
MDGPAVTVTTTVAGQDAKLTFSATAGQRVVLQVTAVSNPAASVYLLRPDGTTQTSFSISNYQTPTAVFFMDTQVLPAPGTYTVLVLHSGTSVGSETLQLNSVPADFTAPITIGGSAVRVPSTGNTAIGQNASLTFSGTSGQQISLNLSNSTYVGCVATLLGPSGNYVTGGYCSTGTNYVNTVTLPTTGTYPALFMKVERRRVCGE